ncbi:RluA family pseudouridine synthase [Cytobacillus depressus]|uniref:Pseudouridine synthase n=1 Tax=Cytobacillus depressus TaxID=1602942 RepID=A0A6L3V8C7_9BACI|nr:RluA family pseudouridine synthase [Cytobacillus depressus]KAB2337702.1 RluA family pseudouridine synthase [Cytobacillus depressus]
MKSKRYGDWFELTVPLEWEGFTIDKILRNIWNAPKKQIHQMRMDKDIKVNGEFTPWNAPLKSNDKLQIKMFFEEAAGGVPAFHPLEVLYEDDHIMVLNKPAHMDTHPNDSSQTNTLLNAAAYYLQSEGEYQKVRHVHRLDRDTTGAVLFAKHSLAGSILDRMLEERLIKRTYLALVHGKIKTKKGKIEEPIGRDRHHATRRRVSASGQPAITHFQLLKTYEKENLSLIKCQLETGRTHQIRVHFSHIGHPLAGDRLYGGKPLFDRQALHAAKLEFIHPFTLEKIICHAQLPEENKSSVLSNLLNVEKFEL